jgi:hypothetical protein
MIRDLFPAKGRSVGVVAEKNDWPRAAHDKIALLGVDGRGSSIAQPTSVVLPPRRSSTRNGGGASADLAAMVRNSGGLRIAGAPHHHAPRTQIAEIDRRRARRRAVDQISECCCSLLTAPV